MRANLLSATVVCEQRTALTIRLMQNSTVSDKLQDLVLRGEDVQVFLAELSEFSAQTVSEIVGHPIQCAVTLKRDKRPTLTLAGNTPEAKLLDEIQAAYGEGPCIEAMKTGEAQLVRNVATDSRWRDYLDAIAHGGQASILAMPLSVDDNARAALNYFSRTEDAFDDASVLVCRNYAIQAQRALLLATRIAAKHQLANDLREAMESRTTINLSIGILMAQNRCSQEEAFMILRNASTNRNMKLRLLAADIVESVSKVPVTSHFDA